MTYGDIFAEFKKNYPNASVSDYRPISRIFADSFIHKCGIIIWLDNGDVILYFPKQAEE